MGPSGLRSPRSQSCSCCGSWDCGSWSGCMSGCGSHDCGYCSSRGCGPDLGSGCGSGLSSRCSSSWRKRRGWVGSRGWDAFGHCRREKQILVHLGLCPSGALKRPQSPSQQWRGLPAYVFLSLGLRDNSSSKLLCPLPNSYRLSVCFCCCFYFVCPQGKKSKFFIDLSVRKYFLEKKNGIL